MPRGIPNTPYWRKITKGRAAPRVVRPPPRVIVEPKPKPKVVAVLRPQPKTIVVSRPKPRESEAEKESKKLAEELDEAKALRERDNAKALRGLAERQETERRKAAEQAYTPSRKFDSETFGKWKENVQKAQPENADSVAKTLHIVFKQFGDETLMDVEDGFLRFRHIDPSHISLIDSEVWVGNTFPLKDGKYVLMFDGDKKMLNSLANGADSVNLEGDKLMIKTGGKELPLGFITQEAYKEEYKDNTYLKNLEEVPIPIVRFDNAVSIPARTLESALKDVDAISDHVELELDRDALYLKGKSEIGNVKVTLPSYQLAETSYGKYHGKGEVDILRQSEAPGGGNPKAIYSIAYLKDMAAAAVKADEAKPVKDSYGKGTVVEVGKHYEKLEPNVTVYFSSKMPVKITTTVDKNARMAYYLAPRVD